MIGTLIADIDEMIFPREGWMRTCILTLGVGASALFCLKYVLSSRRVWCKNNIQLNGKTCIITGANTGIGKAVARELAKRKARVILACRDVQKGNNAAMEIRNGIQEPVDVKVYQLDLASFESIQHFVQQIQEHEGHVDILVNNAGLMCCPFSKSQDGIEMQLAVNHLGHFLLTNLMLSMMKDREDSRIIVVSSSLYKNANLDLVNFNKEENYDPFMAYCKSKLANILFTHELNKKLPVGISINAMHPGVVWTDLGRYQMNNGILRCLFGMLAYFLLRSPDEGAQTIVHMATDKTLNGVSGKYFGDCRMEEVTSIAKDDKVSGKLWEVSEQLTGIHWKKTQ